LLGAFGEELGWRGYLQRIVESKVNVLFSSLLVGVLWDLWHVLYYYQNGPIWLLFFALTTLEYSVIIAWLLQDTDYNVVIAGLFHFAFNIGFYILAGARPDLRLWMLMGLVWGIVAVVIIVFNRKYFLSLHKKKI
jgi:membrane protease YdiL (CAAX protease family)